MTKSSKFIIIALAALCAFFIHKSMSSIPTEFNSQYESIIDSLNIQVEYQKAIVVNMSIKTDSMQTYIGTLSLKNDSLTHVKQTIKHHYHETYTAINNAPNTKLDSIIRSNW